MAKIPVQPTPNNKSLPHYGDKSEKRRQVESNSAVQVLLKTRLLLKPDFNGLLYKLAGDTKQIDNDINSLNNSGYLPSDTSALTETLTNKLLGSNYQELIRDNNKTEADKLLDKLLKEASLEIGNIEKNKIIERIKSKSGEMQNVIDDFETKNRLDIDLEILELRRVYLCNGCLSITSNNRFKKKVCPCSRSINHINDANELTINQINNSVITFIRENMWFEHGVEQLFEEEGYNTNCGYYILGSSGVQHEIDVIAEKSGNKLICECKTTDLSLNDVGNFHIKLVDVGAFKGFIFTTSLNTNPDVKKLAKSKNIAVIEAVLETDKTELKEKIHNILESQL